MCDTRQLVGNLSERVVGQNGRATAREELGNIVVVVTRDLTVLHGKFAQRRQRLAIDQTGGGEASGLDDFVGAAVVAFDRHAQGRLDNGSHHRTDSGSTHQHIVGVAQLKSLWVNKALVDAHRGDALSHRRSANVGAACGDPRLRFSVHHAGPGDVSGRVVKAERAVVDFGDFQIQHLGQDLADGRAGARWHRIAIHRPAVVLRRQTQTAGDH